MNIGTNSCILGIVTSILLLDEPTVTDSTFISIYHNPILPFSDKDLL